MKMALASLVLVLLGTAHSAPLRLHVPSPDWRDQIIYFVMTDRFADGDARNNDQGAGEYDPTRVDRYNGGDLKGLRERLDYVQGLGATALWLTPPVRNQWVDGQLGFTGYHGYWAQHFKQVDPHLGTLADYRALSDALHRRGMYLVQDIVVNHVGNYFDYPGGWDRSDPRRFYTPNPASRPTSAPTQWPFSLNDPRRAADRRAGVYHWTPPLADIQDPQQEREHQMGHLDDLATGNPRVRRALRDSFGHWIRAVGVDAFRVDTAFYVEPEFFHDFIHSRDRRAPGMAEVARRTGRKDFYVFGEGFGIDAPGATAQAERIERYVRGADGQPRMQGMLNFPLYGGLVDAFARGRPTQELRERIEAVMRVHGDPHRMPSFVDNHDVDRWLAGGSEAGLRQALLAIMTLPGVPVLYYGTEQGLKEQRGALFAGGFASGGRDRYERQAPLYRLIAQMSALRRSEKALTRGVPRLLAASASGPGLLAWRMEHEGEALLVVFNSADHELLVPALPSGAAPGARWRGRFALQGEAGDLQADAAGALLLRLPARGAAVWKLAGQAGPPAPGGTLRLDPLPAGVQRGDLELSGTAPAGEALQLVVDGNLDQALAVQAGADGRWRARLPTARLHDPQVDHELLLWSPGRREASAAQRLRVELPWVLLADVADPAGDDHGLDGQLRYPTHESFRRGQMDLLRTRVWAAGQSLRIELEMAELSQVWGPPNGFDHVAFTLFLELPGAGAGQRVMPEQHAELPEGLRWQRRLRAHGWSNALFGPEGAGPAANGAAVAPAARIEVDAATRRVSFLLPAAALGTRAELHGARLFVTTWDYDGGYRPLAPQAGSYTFGGGDPTRTPRVIDASAVITLSTPPP
jgi:glycosidase